ncbi:hypothetical protein BCE_0992 [Bacillus cereus ATCC 10987]|uniref:Uncharacterized protein n=1 Tax=Bacillus cereus (strain ATCC 10987 / NRS 248) TaxID=222523 RepID=Q73CS2_BACC1|nr:hypothetical protein BCE_0992 [Bacillus cereus ATCC 10987]
MAKVIGRPKLEKSSRLHYACMTIKEIIEETQK